MTTNIETHIVGQLLFYPQTLALLPRIKPEWFEDYLCRTVIKNMITNYYTNEPIDYLSVTKGMTKQQIIQVVEIGQ